MFVLSVAYAEVEIVEEGVAFVSHIDKASIEAWHNLANAGQIYVADGILLGSSFALEFDEFLVLEECDGDVVLLDVDNDFACHYGWG